MHVVTTTSFCGLFSSLWLHVVIDIDSFSADALHAQCHLEPGCEKEVGTESLSLLCPCVSQSARCPIPSVSTLSPRECHHHKVRLTKFSLESFDKVLLVGPLLVVCADSLFLDDGAQELFHAVVVLMAGQVLLHSESNASLQLVYQTSNQVLVLSASGLFLVQRTVVLVVFALVMFTVPFWYIALPSAAMWYVTVRIL